MPWFNQTEAESFDEVVERAQEDGEYRIKCCFCQKSEGCDLDDCPHLIAHGDDELLGQKEFSIVDSIGLLFYDAFEEAETEPVKLFAGIPRWEKLKKEDVEDFHTFLSRHPHIKSYGTEWSGSLMGGFYSYWFVSADQQETLLEELRVVKERLEACSLAGF